MERIAPKVSAPLRSSLIGPPLGILFGLVIAGEVRADRVPVRPGIGGAEERCRRGRLRWIV